MAVVRRRVVVAGRVQGVFFRDSARREATARGLSGTVRNRADGAVEIDVEGDEAKVDEVVAWARIGPPGAEVDDVTVEALDPKGEKRFRIV